jgi:heat shock protein HslJ
MKRITFFVGLFLGLIALTACAPSSSQGGGGGDLTGQVWAVSEMKGKGLEPDTGITAQFTSDGKLSGSAGCNQYSGTYTVSGNSITIATPLASTMMACDPAVMEQESVYLNALGEAKTYSINGDQLTFNDAANTTLMTYKSQSQDLAGTSWEVIGVNNGQQAVISTLPDTTITADFGEDGTLSGNSGCNTYNGPYTVDGNQITIGPLSSTMMACGEPAGVMEQEAQYLAALGTAATYQIEGTVLELRAEDGALAVDYSKK